MNILAMGGYGQFVWSAYGITALALGATIVLTLRSYFRAVAQLRRVQSETRTGPT